MKKKSYTNLIQRKHKLHHNTLLITLLSIPINYWVYYFGHQILCFSTNTILQSIYIRTFLSSWIGGQAVPWPIQNLPKWIIQHQLFFSIKHKPLCFGQLVMLNYPTRRLSNTSIVSLRRKVLQRIHKPKYIQEDLNDNRATVDHECNHHRPKSKYDIGGRKLGQLGLTAFRFTHSF